MAKCEACKKRKATCWINGKNVCERCFVFIKNGNEHLIGIRRKLYL